MFERERHSHFESLPSIQEYIDEEVTKDIQRLIHLPEDAKFGELVMREYREAQYSFLSWLNTEFPIQTVLYPGSGHDIIPKLAFGKEKVIHTSLEEYECKDANKFFSSLGEGEKVIANNSILPFRDHSFDAILHFGHPHRTETALWIKEFERLLKPQGLMAVGKMIIEARGSVEKLFFDSDGFVNVPIHNRFDSQGISEASFYLFQRS